MAGFAKGNAAAALVVQVRQTSYSARLQNEVFGLGPAPALAVAQAMYPKLDERPAALQESLRAGAPALTSLNGTEAKQLLSRWIVLENPTPQFEMEWRAALAAAQRTELSRTK